ncbi:hypothetical protein BJ546DRAFT_965617 [Cryomyces antarcticus]
MSEHSMLELSVLEPSTCTVDEQSTQPLVSNPASEVVPLLADTFLRDTPPAVLYLSRTLDPHPKKSREIGKQIIKVDSSSRFGTLELLGRWFPEVDPDHPRAKTWRTRWSNRTTALGVHQATSGTILILNVAWTAWTISRFGTKDSFGTIYQGDCKFAKSLDLWLHLLINVLSTILLASSNFCMQLLVAPTREEVQVAHKQKKWLDIGVPSIRNLTGIARSRVIAWNILGLSSALLHLL